jgi:hypothetical protein
MKNNRLITRCGACALLAAILAVSVTTAALRAGEQGGCVCIHENDWDANIPGQGLGIVFGAPACDSTTDSLGCYFNCDDRIQLEWQCPPQGTSGVLVAPDCQTDDGNACGLYINC